MNHLNRQLADAKKRAQDVIERADKERKRKLFEYRLEIAQQGIEASQKKRMPEAVRAYRTYLKILEETKGIPEGGLHPSHFASKEEQQELLLISGVYWDLVKIFDKAKSDSKTNEFRHYMEKYILFSHQMPFQTVCAETLRKYIAFGKTTHTADFKNTYRLLNPSKCFIASSLVDVIPMETVETLQTFRDHHLKTHRLGQSCIQTYELLAPWIADCLDQSPYFLRRTCAYCLTQVAYFLSLLRL
jgi:hypothetical protein